MILLKPLSFGGVVMNPDDHVILICVRSDDPSKSTKIVRNREFRFPTYTSKWFWRGFEIDIVLHSSETFTDFRSLT
jgi:hypothetical protein